MNNSKITDRNRSYLTGIKANYYRKIGRLDEAISLLTKACLAEKDTTISKRLEFQLTQITYDIGDSTSIISAYQKYLNTYPGDIRSKIIVAEYERMTGEKPIIQPIPQKSQVIEAPSAFQLCNSSPNPFNMSTNIAFDLPEADKVEIVVYDLMGREVWKSAKTHYSPGTYSVIWNGVNHSGQPVGTGMYLVRLNSNKYSATQKVLLMK